MKKLFLFLLFCSTCFLYGQEKAIKKPKRVVIANDEIVTAERLSEYGDQGYIKAVRNGVSEKRWAELFEKLGAQIGEMEFIVELELYTEEEMFKRIKSGKPLVCEPRDETAYFLLKVNDTTKDFTVQMLNGETIKLSDLKEKVVLVNFWATWCAPCLLELYDFPSKIIEPFKNSDFVLLSISTGETREKVETRMAKFKKDGVVFNAGIDPEQSIFKMYAKGGIPSNFLIDKKGIVRYVSAGYSEEEGLEKLSSMIKKLLEE